MLKFNCNCRYSPEHCSRSDKIVNGSRNCVELIFLGTFTDSNLHPDLYVGDLGNTGICDHIIFNYSTHRFTILNFEIAARSNACCRCNFNDTWWLGSPHGSEVPDQYQNGKLNCSEQWFRVVGVSDNDAITQ